MYTKTCRKDTEETREGIDKGKKNASLALYLQCFSTIMIQCFCYS